ncbi:MAG: hypothetical protein IKA87_01820 [Lentisphaeria bacterium]|nr:hypothetical protein [Lentisphaeria bacterium]
MSLKIETAFTGGNVFIENINGFDVLLTRDMRNSEGDWFYWAFRAIFDKIGEYRFTFTSPHSLSSCGPAVSYDDGKTWEWLGFECVTQRNIFTYKFDGTKSEKVIFCVGMQYLPYHLERFLSRHEGSPYLSQSILTYSRKNRPVKHLHIEDTSCPGAKKHVFLSSRHHCCEMMATYALEGILETALGADETGRCLRERYIIDCVPFADTDGVIDGDQGKNRRPHDHNRDYGEQPIYPEVKAIQDFLLSKKLFFTMDLHCPWIYSGIHNETVYFPGPEEAIHEELLKIFAQILEKHAPAEAPFFAVNNLPFGTGWNTKSNYQGLTCSAWIRKMCAPQFAQSIEIPYAIASGVQLTADSVRALGRAIAESIIEYDDLMGN